ncbi:hypothetical protein CBL_07884 [Carabus blaptoides fortunei]
MQEEFWLQREDTGLYQLYTISEWKTRKDIMYYGKHICVALNTGKNIISRRTAGQSWKENMQNSVKGHHRKERIHTRTIQGRIQSIQRRSTT